MHDSRRGLKELWGFHCADQLKYCTKDKSRDMDVNVPPVIDTIGYERERVGFYMYVGDVGIPELTPRHYISVALHLVG